VARVEFTSVLEMDFCNRGATHRRAGLPVAVVSVMPLRVRQRLHDLRSACRSAAARDPRIPRAALALFVVAALALVGGVTRFAVHLRDGLPDETAVTRIGVMDQATAVYDSSDALAFTIYKEQRIDVPLRAVSPNVIHALLASEDQHFYDHHGFDATRMLAAALSNLRHRRAAQGASTITQQLARQSFLTPDKTIRRKLQELVLASRIERMYSKPAILGFYLNKVYFGDGLYGIEAASRGYFGKHASELTVAEAALLVGLVKSPSSYAPTVSLPRARARRNVVLQAMLDNGVLDRSAWEAARAEPVTLTDGLRAHEPHGQYFKEQVRRELVDRFGWQRVYQGGLRVYSTIDMRMQVAAETAVAASLETIEAKRHANRRTANDTTPLQAALIAMDPQTGDVRAMVGGRDFDESHFNRAVQAKRQPGSAFKPFVYATALEAGYSPATLLENLSDPINTPQGAWTPEDEHSSASSMTLRTALRTSSNRAAVRLLQQVGIPRTVEYAKTMGVGELPSVPSLALGSGEVTLQSMTAAYAGFANHGLVPHASLIRRVEDSSGVVLYESDDAPTRAISETTAFLMTSMMADVVNAGTAARARQLGFTLPAAGKTGTTNGFNDAWFVGFTPTLVAGVWVGFDHPQTILPNGFAADIAVPLWAAFMKTATDHDKPAWFSPPAGVTTATVCRLSGKLATPGCENVAVVNKDGSVERKSMVYTEYFAAGTEPTTYCDLHNAPGVLGRIAGFFGAPGAPAPTAIDPTELPAVVATQGAIPPAPPKVEPEGGKRSIWSRIFGFGKDKDKSKDEGKAPKKKGG
jgi:1A family penicillin-binding protein